MTLPVEAPAPVLEGRSSPTTRPATVFAWMWGMAVLLHLLADTRSLSELRAGTLPGLVAWLLAMGAVGLLVRPGDLRLLGVVAGLQLADLALGAPVVGSHWFLAGLASLAVLLALVGGADGFFARFAPAARITVLVAYAWIAFAKLNPAFLDPVTSCAVRFAGDLTAPLGLDAGELAGSGWSRLIALAVLLVELAIPVLLIPRRTRIAGVVVALAFHFVVGLDAGRHFWDFSAVLFPLYVLFLPPSFADHVGRRLGQVGEAVRHVAAMIIAGALVVVVVGSGSAMPRSVGHLLWLTYGSAVLLAAGSFALRHRVPTPVGVGLPGAVLAIVPVLALLNGLTPYLEIKSAYSFTMYSNLHVAGGETNHYLLPGTAPIDGRGGDLVVIRDTTDPALRFYADTGWAVVAAELGDYLADHPDVGLIYERDNRLFALEAAGDDPDLVASSGWLEARLRPLRAVDPDAHPPCQDRWGPAR